MKEKRTAVFLAFIMFAMTIAFILSDQPSALTWFCLMCAIMVIGSVANILWNHDKPVKPDYRLEQLYRLENLIRENTAIGKVDNDLNIRAIQAIMDAIQDEEDEEDAFYYHQTM